MDVGREEGMDGWMKGERKEGRDGWMDGWMYGVLQQIETSVYLYQCQVQQILTKVNISPYIY